MPRHPAGPQSAAFALVTGAAFAFMTAGCSDVNGLFSAAPKSNPTTASAAGHDSRASRIQNNTAQPTGDQIPRTQPVGPMASGRFDPLMTEWGSPPAASHRTDPVIASLDSAPVSSAPTGRSDDNAALDGMESLAQVTFATQGSDFDPSISRDGKWVVYASTQHRPTADIYIKSIDGRTVTQLTADPAQDVMPAISPDGKRIAFASNRSGSWDIYVMSVDGGQAVQVTSDPTHELHPSWSPDGRRIVYCRLGESSGRWEMWVSDIDKSQASEFIGYGLFPTWCPVAGTGDNGRDKILFQRSRERGDRAFSAWTVNYKPGDASSPTEVASSPTAAVINPSWSPDGQRIVFATVPFAGGATAGATPINTDLWMAGVDGSGRVNLTAGKSVNLMPSWSTDGRIYFVSDRAGIENIWSIGTEKALAAATGSKQGQPENASKPATRTGEMATVPTH